MIWYYNIKIKLVINIFISRALKSAEFNSTSEYYTYKGSLT